MALDSNTETASNPYQPPGTCDDTAVEEQSEVILERVEVVFRRVMALLSLTTAVMLGAIAVGCTAFVLGTPSGTKGLYCLIVWAILNVASTVIMGVGLLRRRQQWSAAGLAFMLGSAVLIGLVGSLL